MRRTVAAALLTLTMVLGLLRQPAAPPGHLEDADEAGVDLLAAELLSDPDVPPHVSSWTQVRQLRARAQQRALEHGEADYSFVFRGIPGRPIGR